MIDADELARIRADEVYQVALRLLDRGLPHGITRRQFDCWEASRYKGLSYRKAAGYLGTHRGGLYDKINHFTVMVESRYAHEKIVQAVEDAAEGPIRFDHTVHSGADVWEVDDSTLQTVAWRVKAII